MIESTSASTVSAIVSLFISIKNKQEKKEKKFNALASIRGGLNSSRYDARRRRDRERARATERPRCSLALQPSMISLFYLSCYSHGSFFPLFIDRLSNTII